MTLAPDQDLIKAAIAALKAATAVTGLVGDRIYDRAPEKSAGVPDTQSPYISMGPTVIIGAAVDCIDGVEITVQFDAWSWGNGEAYGSAECRSIVEGIRKTLNEAELSLEDNALATLSFELSRILRDPDGITNHGVIQFTAVVETP